MLTKVFRYQLCELYQQQTPFYLKLIRTCSKIRIGFREKNSKQGTAVKYLTGYVSTLWPHHKKACVRNI